MPTRLAHLPAGIAASVALMLGVSACSQEAEVPTAEVGACLESSGVGSVSELPTVDCDEPHGTQVVGVFDHDGDDFPGLATIESTAVERCTELFEEFVGAPFTDTNLVPSSINPTEQTWNEADDRETICVAGRADGDELTESIEDNAAAFPAGG